MAARMHKGSINHSARASHDTLSIHNCKTKTVMEFCLYFQGKVGMVSLYYLATYDGLETKAQFPVNVILAINHSVFVKGDHTDFEIEPSFRVEASEEYPDVKCTLWMSTSIHLPETSRRRDVRN